MLRRIALVTRTSVQNVSATRRVVSSVAMRAAAAQPVWCVARRALSTGGGAAEGQARVFSEDDLKGMSKEEYQRQVREMARDANQDLQLKEKEMLKLYPQAPILGWMFNHLASPHPEYALAALKQLTASEEMQGHEEASVINFISTVLRSGPSEAIVDFFARGVLSDGVRPDLVLAVLLQVNNDASNAAMARLFESMEKSGASSTLVYDWGRSMMPMDRKPILEVPVPFMNLQELQKVWTDGPTPYEYTASLSHFKQEQIEEFKKSGKGFFEWLNMSTVVYLQALWAHFYATGDLAYIERALVAAMPFRSIMPQLPEHVVVQFDQPLPDEFNKDDETGVTARMSRLAMYTLLYNARAYPHVVTCMSKVLAEAAPYMVAGNFLPAGATEQDVHNARQRAEMVAFSLALLNGMAAK